MVAGKAIRTIAVNDCWRIAPHADLLYAADHAWWEVHSGVPDFAGERWTQDKSKGIETAKRWGLRCVRSESRPGLSFDPTFIHQGGNSGFQVLNLAVLFGAARILLLGFDMQWSGGKSHWFGDHPAPLRNPNNFKAYRAAFDQAAPQLKDAGIEVINCSVETALTCFPRARIQEVL